MKDCMQEVTPKRVKFVDAADVADDNDVEEGMLNMADFETTEDDKQCILTAVERDKRIEEITVELYNTPPGAATGALVVPDKVIRNDDDEIINVLGVTLFNAFEAEKTSKDYPFMTFEQFVPVILDNFYTNQGIVLSRGGIKHNVKVPSVVNTKYVPADKRYYVNLVKSQERLCYALFKTAASATFPGTLEMSEGLNIDTWTILNKATPTPKCVLENQRKQHTSNMLAFTSDVDFGKIARDCISQMRRKTEISMYAEQRLRAASNGCADVYTSAKVHVTMMRQHPEKISRTIDPQLVVANSNYRPIFFKDVMVMGTLSIAEKNEVRLSDAKTSSVIMRVFDFFMGAYRNLLDMVNTPEQILDRHLKKNFDLARKFDGLGYMFNSLVMESDILDNVSRGIVRKVHYIRMLSLYYAGTSYVTAGHMSTGLRYYLVVQELMLDMYTDDVAVLIRFFVESLFFSMLYVPCYPMAKESAKALKGLVKADTVNAEHWPPFFKQVGVVLETTRIRYEKMEAVEQANIESLLRTDRFLDHVK